MEHLRAQSVCVFRSAPISRDSLQIRDLDFNSSRIMVRHAFSEKELVTPKATHERDVPMAPELAELLRTAVCGKLSPLVAPIRSPPCRRGFGARPQTVRLRQTSGGRVGTTTAKGNVRLNEVPSPRVLLA